MKSFQFGGGGTPPQPKRPGVPSLSKKDLEEQKKKMEELAAAEAFEEYVAVFQDTASTKPSSKVWIKAGTYDAGKRQEDTKEKGKLYKPTSRFEKDGVPVAGPAAVTSQDYSSGDERRPDKLGAKKKQNEKKKSNLEIFKEELKIIQEEREERHRLKRMLGLQEVIKLPPKPGDDLRASLSLELAEDVRMGSIDDGDPNTTNIYLGNLPTKISEQQLMEVFGKYGPLASVKVMWPRTEEEKARNRLSGFVAFMSRRDGERALKHLAGKEVLGAEIKLGWGKAVPIPAYPVYIPPQMLELTMPPPLSGLPFNAQVNDRREKSKLPPPGTPYPTDPKGKEEFEKLLANATVKVVMPTDRALLVLVHRMVEFVIREGPMFEAMVMNKEINNPQFRFLFENQSPAHVYYRWKLYSILQGDSTSKWRTEDFRMFRNGSIWRPPKLNPFTQGMPDELIPEDEREIRIGSLSNAQRTRLERMLRRITPERHKVAEVMIFSIEHSESTEEICQCIKESLCNATTSLQKRIARLYVVNDVLHNCTAKGMNAFGYRKAFKVHLPAIFQELHYACQHIRGNNLEAFKQRVMGCFKAWDEWGVYSNEFLIKCQNVFLGLATFDKEEEERLLHFEHPDKENQSSSDEEAARENLQSHRQKLHKKSAPPRAQLPPQSAMKLVKSLQSTSEPEINDEIDGVPLDEPPTSSTNEFIHAPQHGQNAADVKSKFIPSKWEELDPEEVKAQAVTTTSKWDLFEETKNTEPPGEKSLLVGYDDEDIDGVPMEDEDEEDVYEDEKQPVSEVDDEEDDGEARRRLLRDVEVKVIAFQDELEKRGVGEGNSGELVREYRDQLLARGARTSDDRRRAGSTRGDESTRRGGESHKSRSRSPRERSRSSRRSESSRSTSRDRRRSKHSTRRRRSSSSSGGGSADRRRRRSERR